jgi:hypothetical protein
MLSSWLTAIEFLPASGLIIPCELEPEELTRVSIIEQKADVKSKLEALTKELDAVKDMGALTQHDIVHM